MASPVAPTAPICCPVRTRWPLRSGEGARLERAPYLAVRDGDPLDLALTHERQELAHRDFDYSRRQEPALHDGQDDHSNEQID